MSIRHETQHETHRNVLRHRKPHEWKSQWGRPDNLATIFCSAHQNDQAVYLTHIIQSVSEKFLKKVIAQIIKTGHGSQIMSSHSSAELQQAGVDFEWLAIELYLWEQFPQAMPFIRAGLCKDFSRLLAELSDNEYDDDCAELLLANLPQSIETAKIHAHLIAYRKYELLFEFRHLFPQLDMHWLVEQLYRSGNTSYILQNLHLFPKEILQTLENCFFQSYCPPRPSTNVLAYNELKAFVYLSPLFSPQTIGRLLERLITYRFFDAVALLADINHHRMGHTDVDQLSEKDKLELAEECLTQKNYVGLLCLFTAEEVKTIPHKCSWQQVVANRTSLQQEAVFFIQCQDFPRARAVLAYAKILFPSALPEILNLETLCHPQEKHDDAQHQTSYLLIKPLEEVFDYYVKISLVSSAEAFLLPENLRQEIHTTVETLYAKFRELILTVVATHAPFPAFYQYSNVLFHFCSEQDKLLFLYNARTKFKRDNNPRWLQIADYALRLQQAGPHPPIKTMIGLINIGISLEHNHGSIFFHAPRHRLSQPEHPHHQYNSKKERVTPQYIDRMDDFQAFLHFEAQHHSLNELLAYGRKAKIISASEEKHYRSVAKQVTLAQKNIMASETGITDPAIQNAILGEYTSVYHDQVAQEIDLICQKKSLPQEVKLSLKQHFSSVTGFSSETDGFALLGRLLYPTVQKRRINSRRPVGKDITFFDIHHGHHRVLYFSLRGYTLAYWYKQGLLQTFSGVRELYAHRVEIQEFLDRETVTAEYHALHEGD